MGDADVLKHSQMSHVATSNMGVLADDCMFIHVHVLRTRFGSDVFLPYLINN